MPLYLGLTRTDPGYAAETAERARREGPATDAKLARMVSELPEKLPETCRYVSAYSATSVHIDGAPLVSIIVVEAADTSDLNFISQYYAGYLQFQWAPTTSIGATREEREASQAQAAEQAAAAR
jgi:hypothetical protein